MRFIVRSADGTERPVEAASWRRDDAAQQFVFTSEDGKDDQFVPAAGVDSIVRDPAAEAEADRESGLFNFFGFAVGFVLIFGLNSSTLDRQ